VAVGAWSCLPLCAYCASWPCYKMGCMLLLWEPCRSVGFGHRGLLYIPRTFVPLLGSGQSQGQDVGRTRHPHTSAMSWEFSTRSCPWARICAGIRGYTWVLRALHDPDLCSKIVRVKGTLVTLTLYSPARGRRAASAGERKTYGMPSYRNEPQYHVLAKVSTHFEDFRSNEVSKTTSSCCKKGGLAMAGEPF
jgi:hypothetical protein